MIDFSAKIQEKKEEQLLNRATTEIKKKYFKTKEFIAKKKQVLPSIKLA